MIGNLSTLVASFVVNLTTMSIIAELLVTTMKITHQKKLSIKPNLKSLLYLTTILT